MFEAAAALVNRFKRYYLDQGLPVSENPSPGNIAGGITTLEEKSLGAVQKGGQAPLVDVIGYGGQAATPGLTLLEAPGNDAVSSTALAAAGATMVLFTTGRGTPLGFPVPTLKVASNRGVSRGQAALDRFRRLAGAERRPGGRRCRISRTDLRGGQRRALRRRTRRPARHRHLEARRDALEPCQQAKPSCQ